MLRKCAFSAVAIAVLSSGALAGILQQGDFKIGAVNLLAQSSGPSWTSNGNLAVVGQGQIATKSCTLRAIQFEGAILGQWGSTVGACGTLGIMQLAGARGEQGQLIGDCCGPKIQEQHLGVGLGQRITLVGGMGSASAKQGIAAGQLQAGSNPAGMMGEGQFIAAAQDGKVSGVCSNAVVASGVIAVANQGQVVD
jgi:hypothetical protein